MRLILLFLCALTLLASERIVTLSPAIAEVVSGLGSEPDIIGVSDYTLVPKSLQNRPKVGGYFSLSLEKIIALKPTLVIGLPYQSKILKQLQHFNINTLSVKLETLSDIKKAIKDMAKTLHQEDAASMLVNNIETSIDKVKKLQKSKKVLIVFANASGIKKGVYVAGHNLYFEEILHLCGAENAYSDTFNAQPVLHIENLIATNPDTVLLLFGPKDHYDAQKVLASWQSLPINAVKNNSIKILQSDYLLIPSQRVAKSIQSICKAIQ